MTSTNDGKDVKSYQTSGPKGKTYFIELYKTLDGRLSGECELRERTLHLCEAWRRVHSLCQHSAPTTHPHLLSWLQRHTARTVLQTEWQSPKSKDEHTRLEDAIDAFISETTAAAAGRSGASPAWEAQLLLRGEWFKKTLHNPWGHPVLRALLDTRGQKPGDDEILEWLKEERGVMFVTRLRQLAASKCDDLAMALVTAVMDRVRADTEPLPDHEQSEDSKAKPTAPYMEAAFAIVLRTDAGFTLDVWEVLTDIEFVLLHKGDRVAKCIELAKQTPLRNGYQLVERLQSRLETSPREKKLWKNAKDVSILVAQVVIARCMVIPLCAGVARTALYCCTRSLARLLAGGRLPAAAAALAAPAATARHLHTLAAAVDAQCSAELKPFVCELYVRAITAGMNELERLKLKTEKASEARAAEQTLCSWFVQLGNLLAASDRMKRECTLTAFSVHPTPAMYERIKAAHILPPRAVDEDVKHEPTSDYGSWATDSRTQTNLVKTSETLNIKQTQQSANIMSTAILTEGEGLGLMPELCQDLAVLLSGPRVKTLSWDMEREMLLENCRTYMERTHGGTRALTTELKYLNLDPSTYQHLPEEEDDENDVYYGIEKGYEHLVELQEQENIWQTPLFDDEQTESACSSSMEMPQVRRKKKTKNYALFSDDESDPLCVFAAVKKSEKKKERPHSKERSKDRSSSKDKSRDRERKKKPKSATDSAENKERSRERRKDDNKEKKDTTEDKEKKKERKPRKKKPKEPKQEPPMDSKPGSLSSLIGMKVAKIKLPTPKFKRNPVSKEAPCVSDSDYDSQGKSSLASLNSAGNDPDVLFDGLFSMDDYRSPEKYDPLADRQPFSNSEVSFTNGQVAVNTATKPAAPFGIKIHSSSHYQTTPRQNVVKNSNNAGSSDLNATKKVNTVRDEVKKSITKLLEYRRQKTLLEESQRLSSPTPLQNPPPPIYKSPNAIIRQEFPEETVISPKAVDIPEIPKVYINKKQVDQIKDLKNEVDLFLKTKFAPKSVQADQIKDIKNELDDFIKSKFAPKPVVQFAGKQNIDSTPQTKSTVIFESQNMSTSQSSTSIENQAQQDYCAVSHTNKQPESMNQNVPASKISDASMQRNFHDFLRELQESINAGTGSGAKKTAKSTPNSKIKKEIKPTSKVSPIIPAVTSKNKPSSSPSAKSFKQGKKVETQLNTFSRLSYMHKNKQQNNTPLDLLNSLEEDHKLSKHNYLQSIGAVTISRKNVTQSATTSDKQNVIRKVERQTTTTASYPVLTDIHHTKQGAIPKRMNSQESLTKKQQPQSEKAGVKIWPHPKESSLSERDQNDLLLLLRQQSNLKVHPTPVNNTGNVCKVNKTVNNLQCSKISTASNKKCNPEAPVGPQNLIKKYPMNKKAEECNINMTPDVSDNMIYTKMDYKTSKVSKTATAKKANTTPNKATVTSITPHQHILKTDHGENPLLKKYGATTEDTSRQDWEKVMDAILSHKTPSRGPNALDMVLKKEKTLRSQRIVKPNHINNTQVSNVAIQPQSTVVSSMPNTSLIHPAPIVSTPLTVQLPHTNMKLDRSQKPNELTNYLPSALTKQQSQIIQQEVMTRCNQLEPTTKVINESYQLESAQESQLCKQINKLPKNRVFHQKEVQKSCTHNTFINKKHPVHQEIVKKVHQLEQNTEINAKVQKKPITTELLQEKDPFISGIPNSDYDLLEELMDDELRKEIGELSSDEDTYRAPTCTVKGSKLLSFDRGSNVIKNTEMQQDKVYPISGTNIRQNCRETIHTNNQTSVQKCQTMSKKASNIKQHVKDCKVTPKFVEKSSVPCSNVTHQPVNTNVMSSNENNEQHPSMITNSQINVVGARNVIITALPQAALQNVVLIGSELVYDPYATTQTQVNSGMSNANQAPYVTFNNNTNNNPNIAVYQSTHFTDPVVNSIIIGNAMAMPLPSPSSEILDSALDTGINNMDACNHKAVPLSSTSSEMLESPLDIEINRINSSNQTPMPLPATPSEILNIPLDLDLNKQNSNNQNIKDNYLTSLHEAIRMHEVKSNENISSLEMKKVTADNILQDEIIEEFIKQELNLLDINSNKNCERKVLKEVQEKENKLIDQINSIKIKTKSPEKKEDPNELENITIETEFNVLKEPDQSLDNMGDVENLMDIERIKNKRFAIINREISNRSNNPPIPLSYAPLVSKTVANITPHNEDNNDNSKGNESNATQSRRILLRSSNSLKSNAVASDSELSKNAVVRKMKVRLKDESQENSVKEANNLDIKADSSGKDNTVPKKPKRERKQQTKDKKGQKVNSTGTVCSIQKSKIPKSTLKVDNKTEDIGTYVNGATFNFIDIQNLETNEPKILVSPLVDKKNEHKKATTNDEHECLPRNGVHITNNMQRDLLETESPSRQGFKIPVLKSFEEYLLMNRKISKNRKHDIDLQAKLDNLYSSTGLIAKSLKSVKNKSGKIVDNKQMPNDKSASTINSDVVKFQSKTTQKDDTPNGIATSLIRQGYKATEVKDSTKNRDIIKNLPVCNITDKNEQGVQPLNRKSVAFQGIEQSSISSPTAKCEEDSTKNKSKQKSGLKDKNALVDSKEMMYLKNNITIEELPSTTGDPNNKCVRLKLANGKVFKATVFGKMHVSFESLFSNPALKNTLLSDLSQSSQRYTLNIKQVSLMNKQDPSQIIDTRIEEIKMNSNADIIETVNLLSEDEDEADSNIQYVATEYGNYKISPVHEQDFERHKIKLKQKCFVKLNTSLVVEQKMKVQIKTNNSNKENNKFKNTEQIFIDTKDDQSQSEAGLDKTTSDIMTPVIKTPEIPTTVMKTTDMTDMVMMTQDITTTRITNPYITTTGVKMPEITTPDISISGIKTTGITSTDIITPDITTTGITTPDATITRIKTTDITTIGITSTDIITPDLTKTDIKTPDITTTEMKDTDVATTGIKTPVITTPDITTTTILATPNIVTPVIASSDIATPDIITPDKAIPDNITQDQTKPANITPDRIAPVRITPDNTTSEEIKIEIPIVYVNSLLASTKARSSAVSEVIEIDDSSNDSVNVLISYPIPPIVQSSHKMTSCSKPKEMINELKHLLLKDLGVEDTEVYNERPQPENHQHSVSNESSTSETTCPKIKKCFVELTRCDYLVKQYEQKKIIKQKCTIDLIRCDDIIQTPTEICNKNILEIGSDEFIDVEGIECESPSQLSRSGSFSILNDFSFYTEKTTENYESANASYDYDRSSPVIDIFETIAAFKNYSIGNKGKRFPEQNQSNCYSEWYKTKLELHLESCVTNNDRHALSDNIVVDNLTLSNNKNLVNDSLPSLKTLTANIFQDYSTLDRYTMSSQLLTSCLIDTDVKQTSLHCLKRKRKYDERKSCENKIFKTLANINLDRHTKVSNCQQDLNVTSSKNKIISIEKFANDENAIDKKENDMDCYDNEDFSGPLKAYDDDIKSDTENNKFTEESSVDTCTHSAANETIHAHSTSDADIIKIEPLEVELKSHETIQTHISSDAAIITTESLEVSFNSHEELQDSVKNAIVENSTDSKVSDDNRTVLSIDLQNYNVYSKSHKENINEHLSNVTNEELVMLDKIKEIATTNTDIRVSKTEVHPSPNEKKTVLQFKSEENKESEVVEAASEQSIDEYEHEVNIKQNNLVNISVNDELSQQNFATTPQGLETLEDANTLEISAITNNDIIDVKKSNVKTLHMSKPAINNINIGKSSDEHLNGFSTDKTCLILDNPLTLTANTEISDNNYKEELSESRYELMNIKNNCQSSMLSLGSYDYKIEVTEDETLSDGDSVYQNNFENIIEKNSPTLNKCNYEESMKNETILTGGCEINNTQPFIKSPDANVFQDNKIVDERINSDDKVIDTESNNREIQTVKILTEPELGKRQVAVCAIEKSAIYNSNIVENINTQDLNNSQDPNLPKGNKDPILKLKEEVIYYDENVIGMQINASKTENKEIAIVTLEKTEVIEGNDCVESKPEEIFENGAQPSESLVAVNISLRGKISSELKCLDVNKDSKVEHTEPVNLLSSLITDVKGSGDPLDFEASFEVTSVESLEQSLENPARKEVTLIYKDGTDLVLNGIEYEDPVVGTCYVFPLANDSNLFNENDDSEEVAHKIDEDININKSFDDEYILELKKPTITYSKQSNTTKSKLKKIKLNILKRKIDMSDVKYIGKRYRKGQFDYPRLLLPNFTHNKEYKKVFDYCSSLKFSFSQPFHKENIDVEGMVENWPIKGSYCNNLQDESENENILFRDDEKGEATKNLINVSFAEEINADYIEDDLLSDNIDEANFNMGFGEGSDRVIQNLKDVGDVSKFSAATLSDVKQPQPFLLSEDTDDCQKKLYDQENTKKDQLIKMKRCMSYINLRDKVRSFFKKTTVELCSEWIRQKNDKSKPSKNYINNFPFDLYQTDFIEPPPIEAVVQVVQVGQLPVSAAAQNPVTCDPRVTQVSDASPSQCSVDNSPQDDSEVTIKTEYTELTTADFTLPPMHEHIQHNQNMLMESQNTSYSICNENIPIETEIKSDVKIEIEELPEIKEENREIVENNEFLPAENNEFLSAENNEFLPAENNEFLPAENNEFLPAENNAFQPAENNEFLPAENNQFQPAENNEFQPAENNEFLPAENNEFQPAENNEFQPAENNEFQPAENNEFLPAENNEFVPVENNELLPVENNEFLPVENKQQDNHAEYMCETNNAENTGTLESETDYQNMLNSTEKQNINESYEQQVKQQNGTPEKTDQIAHAMNAAGITTTTETMTSTTTAHALVNMLSQNLCQEAISATQTATNNYSKTTAINALALQQALAQILPPPLNQTTSNENNQQSSNAQMTPQVLHIVQGKNATGSQITLVDNSQQSVINNPNATPVLHIVQNKSGTTGVNPNGTANSQTNSFSGLSLVDAGLQQGGNQLLHIVNTGNQKNNNATGQLLKRVNLLTNLTNVQGSNEQKMVQFVCKSADGKSIQLNAPHQRSMVLRLQPIESPNCNVQAKPAENQDTSPNANSLSGKESQEIKSRSVYEENYAKFIQNSSNNKSTLSEKSTSLPKFNQAFGKPVFQEGNQKQNDINSNNSHLQTVNSNSDANECQPNDNAINLDHIGQMNSPPLLLRKSPQTSQAQANLVQQLKQTMAPMNIQTMHGGVIYTRQIPVNIGGGQTINLITVPSTEFVDDSASKQSGNQNELEQSIIKIVPQNQNNSNNDMASEDGNATISGSNETTQNSQTQQPVLTQMRIKLPMLSKAPQMVSGARVVRPSFFQIQRNVIGGANQPVYQQLVLTAAPPLGQQTIRLPQTQTGRSMKVATENQSAAESQMSSSTLEQLREFDMVLEQVKERSTTVQPSSSTSTTFPKLHTPSTDITDGVNSASSTMTETTQQVLYSICNNQALNVSYVNRKATVSAPVTSTYVRSPDSSGIVDTPTTTHVQIRHTVTSETTHNGPPPQPKPAKVTTKPKPRPKASSNPPNTLKLNTVPPKTSTQKPFEDEQTTQRILYILAEYKEQVENSPDKNKPAPRRRTNPPSNPGSSKRKRSSSSRRHGARDLSPIHGDDSCRTMGSEDSSCGTSQGDCNESCLESHSPQDSPRKVVRKLTFEHETPTPQPRPQPPQRNVIVADGQTITVARGTAGKPTTTVLMPANYILPVSMMKGGQQIAIVTNRGPKLLTVGGEGGTTNALLLQRLIGPAGLKPVLTRPGVRHVRLPTAALHNLQAFNLATATTIQPDSTASPAPAPNPPELVDTRATSSPWTQRNNQNLKPDRASSPDRSVPWHLPASADPHDYSYEETVRTENMDRTVLDPIPDRYSPDMEAQRIFDKMFDVESKKSYMGDSHDDSPRCAYDIDASDCDDKAYHQVVQKKDGHRQHRLTHVSAAALRHKYAVLEHELRLQKSLSEECEDLGVDSPSASELFPEAELLFAASPAHDHNQEQGHQSHTPQSTIVTHSSIPQPDMDDQIATDQLLSRNEISEQQDLNLGLEDVGIVTVSEDGMQATIALDQEEFARSHPNTTFHREPTEEGVIQPYTIVGPKGRHITSTIFHAGRAPATVLMTAPQTTVISQAGADPSQVKYDINNMIHLPPGQNNINLASVLVKDDGLTRFDSILNDNRELHLSNTASAIVHSSGNATQVIRRVCYDDDKNTRFLMDEPDALIAGDDAKMVAEDNSRDAIESMTGDIDHDRLSPERNAELFWESNSASERSESRRPMDFSSDSEKCCKSPSYDETNSTDSSGVGTHMRLDSVIKDARGIERSASADCSSADDTHPPLRTYPPKRLYHPLDGHVQRSLSGKTRAGERSPDSLEVRRRASGRGVVKRGCHCCNGSPAPPRPKKSRQRKPTTDFTTN